MLSRTDEGRRVRRYFIECEQLVHEHEMENEPMTLPDIMISDFLQAVTDRFRKLEYKHDEAIRTKAQISDRMAPAAMNTAAQAVKLQDQALQLVKQTRHKSLRGFEE